MSPRPRKVSDDDVFAAAHRAMAARSPADLTLADIAAEAGVTSAALVQRFGSRRALLLALCARFSDGSAEFVASLRAAAPSALAAVRAYAECMAGMAATPETAARSVAWLLVDLTDPDFHVHLQRHAAATRGGLAEIVREAVASGELAASTDAAALARTIDTVVCGSIVGWATFRAGSARDWIVADVEAVLAPHIPRSGS